MATRGGKTSKAVKSRHKAKVEQVAKRLPQSAGVGNRQMAEWLLGAQSTEAVAGRTGRVQLVAQGRHDAFETKHYEGTDFKRGPDGTTDLSPNQVEQGALRDRHFIAALRAIARSNPDALRGMIADNGDGTYNVRLNVHGDEWSWERSPITVHNVSPDFPSTRDGPAYARFANNSPAYWVALIEKAYAIHKGSYAAIEEDDAANAMGTITGREPDEIDLAAVAEGGLATELKAALDADKAVTACTLDFSTADDGVKKQVEEMGLVGDHAYAVVQVDLDRGTIDLDNPWGQDHLEGVSIRDFKRFFKNVQVSAA